MFFPCNESLQVDDNFEVSSTLQVLSGFGIYSGENEKFGEDLRRPKELTIAERFLGERRRIVGIGLEMASLSIDKEETGNEGRMWALQQQLDPPMDEEGGRLRNRYDEKLYNIILCNSSFMEIAAIAITEAQTRPNYGFKLQKVLKFPK